MILLDTSVLVAVLAREPAGARLREWMAGQAVASMIVSDWAGVELASALGIKLRTGQIDDVGRTAAWAAWQRMKDDSFGHSPIQPSDMTQAAALLGDTGLGLRAGDALHLAQAIRLRTALATLDLRLAAAGRAKAVGVQDFA